jgi:hypothetical protein
MSAGDLKGLLKVGIDILTTTVNKTTKKILAQTGNAVAQTTDSDSVEWWQHYGYASRPPKPEPGKQAAQALVLNKGDYDIAIASQDLRGLELYGTLDHGETCVYSAGDDGKGQARALFKKDGSVHLYTRKGNTESGGGMVVQLDAQNGVIRLVNDKGYGLIIDQDGIKLTAKDSALTLGGDGSVSLVGKGKCQIDGSGICLGSTAVPGVNSALCGISGPEGVASTKVLIAIS